MLADLWGSLEHFTEAVAHVRRRRIRERIQRRVEKRLAKAFRAQGAALLKRLPSLKDQFQVQEKAGESDPKREWVALFSAAEQETLDVFVAALDEASRSALLAGGNGLVADLVKGSGLEIAFDLKHPAAVEYLKQRAAQQIAGINETTRQSIARLLAEGIEQGKSYDEMARAIKARFEEFAVGRPQEHVKSRAHLVAITEVGEAYSEGNRIIAADLAAGGMEIEKQWLTAGDNRVSKECEANAAQGWIGFDEAFASGDERPLRFPGCRCDCLYRRKPDGN